MDHKREIINLESWQNIPLRDLVEFIRGVTFPKGSRLESYEKGTVAVATTKAAQLQGIEHDKLYFIPKSFVKRSEQFLLPNDIVVSIANSLDLVGRVTFTTQKDEGITWGAFLGVIRGNSKLISPYFLYAFLTTAKARQYFRKHARTTTNISNISSDTILSLSIPVPSLAEQKRIVKKIEELFGVIDEQVKRLEATQEALISYRQSILQQIFSTLPQKTTLRSIFKTSSGGTPSRRHIEYYQGNIPWVKSGELNYNTITDTEEHLSQLALDDSSAKLFPKGSLLIALYGATIGRLAFLGVPAATNQAVCCIFPNKQYDMLFLYYFLQHKQKYLIFQSKGGAQKNISQEILKELPIPTINLPEQKAIVKKIETAFAFADKAQAAITDALEQAKQLKQSILKRAFEGKLVPQDPNDKPIDLTQLKKDKQK